MSLLSQVSIDILTVLVRWSPVPLSDVLVSQIFPAVVHCTLHTDDSSTMQVHLVFGAHLTLLERAVAAAFCLSVCPSLKHMIAASEKKFNYDETEVDCEVSDVTKMNSVCCS